MMRATIMIAAFGAVAQRSAPTRNSPPQTSCDPLRPSLSASLPPSSEPRAAPGNSRTVTTAASVVVVRFRFVLHVQQRTGDDTGVVAEQQSAECRDDREFGQMPATRSSVRIGSIISPRPSHFP
jgi:hypothetical protein